MKHFIAHQPIISKQGKLIANRLTMHVPAEIVTALTAHGGQYAPLYDMALAAEGGDPVKLAGLVDSLGLRASQVNGALLQALSFSTSLSV